MNIWRLIPHHEFKTKACEAYIQAGRIAVGWNDVGDLSRWVPRSADEVRDAIKRDMPHLNNAHLGGPSLWNFWCVMKVGDLVIAPHPKGRPVFEVTGKYEYLNDAIQTAGYHNTRRAELTDIDGNALWEELGGAVAPGEPHYQSVALLQRSTAADDRVYREGAKYDLTTTARERNPAARKACIEKMGCRCVVCNLDFGERYGQLGEGFIHVHHTTELAARDGEYLIDLGRDLVPLCPNCHAMAHRTRPPISIEALIAMLRG
jgi:hypothetical protein